MAENSVIPKELEILNPEWQVEPILIGTKLYQLYPLTEGQAEKLSKIISELVYDIYTTDAVCPKCRAFYHDAVGNEQIICTKCKDITLDTLQKSAIDAVLGKGRIKKVLAELLGIKEIDVSRATVAQLRYIAGLLYLQNFNPETTLPEGSEKNFQELLGWMGVEMEPRQSALEPSTSISPESTDSPENTSKENGKTEG
jgi:hypothetical protein